MATSAEICAVLGSTGTGKSALAAVLAEKYGAQIFSIDSLSVYKNLNIFSAKPDPKILKKIPHVGVNELFLHEKCDAMVFLRLFHGLDFSRPVIIVGGSSFFLKSMISGLSVMPEISPQTTLRARNTQNPHDFLMKIDPITASKIEKNDIFRIYKNLEIFFATNTPPSEYFAMHPRQKIEKNIRIFAITLDRKILHENLKNRLQTMLDAGAVDEIAQILKCKNSANFPALKAIGPRECVEFLRQEIDFATMKERILARTKALAKRQNTFNRTQFSDVNFGEWDEIFAQISHILQKNAPDPKNE